MVAFINFPQHSGLRLRSDKLVRLDFYKSEDYAKHAPLQTIFFPPSDGAWAYVSTNFENNGILYIRASSLDGKTQLDFDRIDTEAAKVLPFEFKVTGRNTTVPTYVGRKVEQNIFGRSNGCNLFGKGIARGC